MKKRSRQILLSVWALGALALSSNSALAAFSCGASLAKLTARQGATPSSALSPAWQHVEARAQQLLPANPTDTQIRAALRDTPDFADRIQAALGNELQPQKEAIQSKLKAAGTDAKLSCGSDAPCIERQIIANTELDKVITDTCPTSPFRLAQVNQAAFLHQVRNLAVGLSAIGFAHTARMRSALEGGEVLPDFPFDSTATAITLTILRTKVMCKNLYSAGAQDPTLTRMQKIKRNFLAYQGVILYGNFIYIGFVASEDWARGEDVLSKEKLRSYGTEFVVSYVWDQAFGGLGVVILDPFAKWMAELGPRGALKIGSWLPAQVNGWLVKKGDKNFLFMKVGNPLEIPGVVADYASRFGQSTARSWLWLQVRDLLARGAAGAPTAP
jgi:hypothetical protein